MKLSIFTTETTPIIRGDLFWQSVSCYLELSDELVRIEGRNDSAGHNPEYEKVIVCEWPQEFSWEFIGQQFQRGYEACTGDWVIHADLDFIFHERDYDAIRKACENAGDAPALSFWKYQFILPDRYILKSRLVIAVNKGKYGDLS